MPFKQVVAGPGNIPLSSDLNQLIWAMLGQADVGPLTLAAPIAQPAAPTLAAGSAGVLTGGYRYIIVLVSGWMESNGTMRVQGFVPGVEATQLTVASQQINLSNIPIGPVTCIARLVYRTAANGAVGTEKFAFAIADNTTTAWSDNVVDASLGTGMPTWQGTAIPANVPVSNTTGTTLTQYIANAIFQVAGDIIYASAPNTPARLAKGSDGQLLGLTSGLPTWVNGGYQKIAEIVVGTPVTSVQFTNIPSGFTAFKLIIVAGNNVTYSGSSGNANLQFNGDSAADYWIYPSGGANVTQYSVSGVAESGSGYPFGFAEVDIVNLTGQKSILARFNTCAGGGAAGTSAGSWNQSALITSIFIFAGGSYNFTTGSTFILLGVK